MKKRWIGFLIAVCCMSFAFATVSFAQNPCQVQIYDTDNEGLALKASPDMNAARYLFIPENAGIYIDQTFK